MQGTVRCTQEDPAAMLRLHVVLFRVLAGLSEAFFLCSGPPLVRHLLRQLVPRTVPLQRWSYVSSVCLEFS